MTLFGYVKDINGEFMSKNYNNNFAGTIIQLKTCDEVGRCDVSLSCRLFGQVSGDFTIRHFV